MPFERVFGSFTESLVHPEAGLGFLGSKETDSLDLELFPDPLIEILASDDDIPAIGLRSLAFDPELFAESLVSFRLEEGDLSFEIRLVVEIAITANPATCDAFDLVDFDDRILSRRLSKMPDIVVIRGNVDVFDFHPAN